MKTLPVKTVERLSQYRRNLLKLYAKGVQHVFSHEIAALLHITPVNVRRDLMLIGYAGTLRKGYHIRELIDMIGKIIDAENGQNVAVVGVGNLGRSLITYINGKRSKLNIVAGFDINTEKTGKVYAGVPCYHIDEMNDIIKKDNISIAILAVPGDHAAEVAAKLAASGIKGILNYTPTPLNVSSNIYLEEHDMITSLEKVAYYVKTNTRDSSVL